MAAHLEDLYRKTSTIASSRTEPAQGSVLLETRGEFPSEARAVLPR